MGSTRKSPHVEVEVSLHVVRVIIASGQISLKSFSAASYGALNISTFLSFNYVVKVCTCFNQKRRSDRYVGIERFYVVQYIDFSMKGCLFLKFVYLGSSYGGGAFSSSSSPSFRRVLDISLSLLPPPLNNLSDVVRKEERERENK